jgi:ubiquinone/menaquinone biosynthesis C-methylase UbiE
LAAPEPWDLVADAYAVELLPMFEAYARDALEFAALPEPSLILDVAAGPGTVALMAARDGLRAEAIDFSPLMVENLRRRIASEGVTGVNVQVADGQALPFADESFDGAFSMFGLMFFPDRARGFRELRRVLRPGKRAVVSSWAPMEGVLALMFDSLREALPELGFNRSKPPLGDAEEFAEELKNAGFHDVKVHTVVHEPRPQPLLEFWGMAERTTAPIVLLQKKLGKERWAAVSQVIYDKMLNELGPGDVTIAGRAHLGVGVK